MRGAAWIGRAAEWVLYKVIDAWDAADERLASAGADLGWGLDEEDSP